MNSFLPWLIDAGWQAAVMAFVLGLLLLLIGRRIPSAWRYAILFLIVVRLLLPSLPEAPISAYRMVPPTPAAAWEQSLPSAPVPTWLESRPGVSPLIMTGTSRPQPVRDWKSYVGIVWAIGAAGLAAWLVMRQFLFHLGLRRHLRPTSPALQSLLEEAATLARLRTVPHLQVVDTLPTPALTGLLRPVILLPAELAHRLPAASLRHILLHECVHLRRGDLWTHFLALIAAVIHWCNPVAWWLMRRLHAERELATDAGVLRCLHADERPAYGETLLDLASGPALRTFLQPSLGVLERHTILRRRIRQIAGFGRISILTATIGVILLTAVTATLLVRAPSAPLEPIPEDTQSRERLSRDFIDRVRANDLPAVQRYLQRGLDINVTNHYDNALYWAVTEENFPMVRFLVQKGARVNDKNRSGDTPVRRACWLGNKKIADFLIASGATYDSLLYYAGMGDLAALEKLNSTSPLPLKQLRQVAQFSCTANQQSTFDWAWKLMEPQLDDAARQKVLSSCLGSAASCGRLPMLRHLVTMGVDVRKDGAAALFNAALRNHPTEVRYLLEHGAPINSAEENSSLLRNTAGEGYVEVMKALLDHGADINQQDEQGYTPLVWAASCRQDAACKLLIERGADISIKTERNETALWRAAFGGNSPDTVKLLLSLGADPSGSNSQGTPILSAMQLFTSPQVGQLAYPGIVYTESETKKQNGRTQRVVELLIQAGADPNAVDTYGRSPLENALTGGHPEIAMALIRNGADPNRKDNVGNMPLTYAFLGNVGISLDVIKELLSRGADPNTTYVPRYTTPVPSRRPLLDLALQKASMQQYDDPLAYKKTVKAIEYLLQHGARFVAVGPSEGSEWLAAAAMGDRQRLRKLLASGVDINTMTKEGWNALGIAFAMGKRDEARWLIEQGSSLVGSTEMTSPLYFAALTKDLALAEMCLAAGAKPTNAIMAAAARSGNLELFQMLRSAGGDASHMPIYTLVRQGYADILRLAIESGADVNPKSSFENRNYVYWAVQYNHPEVLKLLLEAGVEPNMKDAYGRSPLDNAKKFRPHLVPMLEEAIERKESQKTES